MSERLSSQKNRILRMLDERGVNLMILKNGMPLYSSSGSGVAPLVEAIDELGLKTLYRSTVVDKVIGRAAALLISYMKAEEAYSMVMSRQAVKVFEKYGVRHLTESLVENIKGREGIDLCPFEEVVLEVDDARKGYERILAALGRA